MFIVFNYWTGSEKVKFDISCIVLRLDPRLARAKQVPQLTQLIKEFDISCIVLRLDPSLARAKQVPQLTHVLFTLEREEFCVNLRLLHTFLWAIFNSLCYFQITSCFFKTPAVNR